MKQIIVNIRRHSLSNKKDVKKDYSITPEGWDLAVEAGKQLIVPEGGIEAYASPKTRAEETAMGILFGAYQANPQRDVRWTRVIQGVESLDSMASYITRIPDVKAVFDSMALDDGVNLVLNEDPEAVKKAARDIQDFITRYTKPIGKDYLVDGTTHGAKVESGLIGILRMMGIPVNDIREIGGAFKETEHFSVELHQNESNTALHKVSFRGEIYKHPKLDYVASWLNQNVQ